MQGARRIITQPSNSRVTISDASMNIPRAVVFGVIGGALAAWFASASTSGPRPLAIPAVEKAGAIDKSGAQLAAEIERLHDRLHPTATPEQPQRNLFEFGAIHVEAPPRPPVAP